jgi:hypothetical protein
MTVGSASGGFAHLLNVTAASVELPYEIIPGHRLSRANIEQARRVRHQIVKSPGPGWKPGPVYPYEIDVKPGEAGVVIHTPLQEAEWRYFIIEFDGDDSGIRSLEQAEDLLCGRHFELGLVHLTAEGSDWIVGRGIRTPPSDLPMDERGPLQLDVKEPDLLALREVQGQLAEHDHEVVDLRGVLRELYELRMVDPRARLRFLAYFAVLESVLTHKPKPEDRYDSITRQVKAKMRLIANRTRFSPTYVQHFGDAQDKIWDKLYEYRSAIAHGGYTDLTSGAGRKIDGKLSALRSHDNAMAFLIKATSCVLRFALTEPELLRDLHNC